MTLVILSGVCAAKDLTSGGGVRSFVAAQTWLLRMTEKEARAWLKGT